MAVERSRPRVIRGVVFVLGQIQTQGATATGFAALSFLVYLTGISLAVITLFACVRRFVVATGTGRK